MLTGEVFVVPRPRAELSAAELLAKAKSAGSELCELDWRLHGVSIVPVSSLEERTPPRLRDDADVISP